MKRKLASLFMALALTVSSFSGVYAASETSPTVTVTEAKLLDSNCVYLKGKVTNPTENQELTIIAVKLENGNYDSNNSVYIDQQTSIVNDDGTFSLTFTPKEILDSNSEYLIKVSGTDVSEYSSMKIKMGEGGEVTNIYYVGDVDDNDVINANDAALVLQYVLNSGSIKDKIGSMSVSEFADRADVFGNKKITAKNASAILQKALNNDYEFVRKDESSGGTTESTSQSQETTTEKETHQETTTEKEASSETTTSSSQGGSEDPTETTTQGVYENPEFEGDMLVDVNLSASVPEENKYKTISEAIAAIKTTPTENDRVEIDIMPGVYREQVYLRTPYVTLRKNPKYAGEVKLTWYYGTGSMYDSVNDSGYYDPSVIGDGKVNVPKDWGAALKVDKTAKGTIVKDMTFENSYNQYYTQEELDDNLTVNPDTNNSMFDRHAWIDEQIANGKSDEYINNWIQSRTNMTYKGVKGSLRERAAAFHCSADKFEAYNCTFISKQDTMGINSGREYYENCKILGTVDYICGSATAVFNKCELRFDSGIDMHSDSQSVDSKAASDSGYITAPAMGAEDKGYLFYKCSITANDNIGSAYGSFGRPWGNAGGPEAIYYKTTIGTNSDGKLLIKDEGWDDMSGTKKDQARFYEYGSVDAKGNAVDTSKRVRNAVAPFGSVVNEWQILEFNPYNYTKGTDGWDPMNMAGNYSEFEDVLKNINFDSNVKGDITLPTAPTGYEFLWESDTDYAVVSADNTKVSVTRPAYGQEPINAKLTVYIKKTGTEFGVKDVATLTIQPNATADNTFNTTGNVSLGTATDVDVNVKVEFIQNNAVIGSETVTIPAGQTTATYSVNYLPAGEYSVKVVSDTNGYRVTVPTDGTTTITGTSGNNQTIDISVKALTEVTIKTEDFSESWAKPTATKANDKTTATVVTGTATDTANIGEGNKAIRFTKAEGVTVGNDVGFYFDLAKAVKDNGGTLSNTDTLQFSYDLLLEKDKAAEGVTDERGYMASEYSFIDFTTKLTNGGSSANQGRFARYGIHQGWNQLNFFTAANSRVNGDNTQFDKNSTMRNKWYHIVTDVNLKEKTIYVTVYNKATGDILNKKKFVIAEPNVDGENKEYPTALVKDALYTAVYMDKNADTTNRIEFYLDNIELTYQDFK